MTREKIFKRTSGGKKVPQNITAVRVALWALVGLAFLAGALTVADLRGRLPIDPGVKRLSPVEVREYQGEKLSSVTDLPDNSIKGPQHVDLETYRLGITGLVDGPQKLTYAEVLDRQRYAKVIDLFCVEGWSARLLWEGVLVRDLLQEAGAWPEADTVIFHAQDGYTTSLPRAYFEENDILLGFNMNGSPLLPETGFPFQLVAEDKWGYKWIKWVTQIELSDDPDYRGTWEQYGYSNSGDLGASKFEPLAAEESPESCNEDAGEEWCQRLKRCVDPWFTPCELGYDAAVIRRMDTIRRAASADFSYPVPTTVDWRRYPTDYQMVQLEIAGWTMEALDSDALYRIETALLEEGYRQDIHNMADGAGSGRWGFVRGGLACVLQFQAVEFYGPDEPEPDHPINENDDITVSCGRLP